VAVLLPGASTVHLDLAIVLQCDDTVFRLQLLERDQTLIAAPSDLMQAHDIRVEVGQVVAVDASADPPQIVYRWSRIRAAQNGHGYRLAEDDQTVDVARLHADKPKIAALYARAEAAQGVDPKQLVQRSYDQIAERYLEWSQDGDTGTRHRYVSLLMNELPLNAHVLELGCGAGVPATQLLAQRFEVTGVDISNRQLELARQNVPHARFVQADMASLSLAPNSYHGVLSLFAIFHVPRDEQPGLLKRIAAWLRPGGLLVATMGTQSSAGGVEDDWLGAPMYWSTFDAETNLRLVREAGLEVVRSEIETVQEFGETVSFLWIVAQKPKDQT
jgi:ubiquinone/menaquinone biosynthesis C-methylase UbiE